MHAHAIAVVSDQNGFGDALALELKGPNLSFLRSFPLGQTLDTVLKSVYDGTDHDVIKIEAAERQSGPWWQVTSGEVVRTLATTDGGVYACVFDNTQYARRVFRKFALCKSRLRWG